MIRKDGIKNLFLDLIKKYELIDSSEIEKISFLRIIGKVRQLVEIEYKFFNQDTGEYDVCIVQPEYLKQLSFNKDLLKLLLDLEFIGNQSHIQKLEIVLNAEELPIIKIEQLGMTIHPTIFEEKVG
jgi:hypothetical protein